MTLNPAQRPAPEDWDLPSDADMLNWLERYRADLRIGGSVGWAVIWSDKDGPIVFRGATSRAALEAAMKGYP